MAHLGCMASSFRAAASWPTQRDGSYLPIYIYIYIYTEIHIKNMARTCGVRVNLTV